MSHEPRFVPAVWSKLKAALIVGDSIAIDEVTQIAELIFASAYADDIDDRSSNPILDKAT